MEKQTIETHVIKPRLSIFSNEVEYRLISTDYEQSLDKKIDEIGTYMANNNGFGKEESYKDELYGNAQLLWNEYASILRDVKYTFYLNRKQFNFLTSLLRDKLEYDVNTIFLAIELTKMLGLWVKSEEGEKYNNDEDIRGFSADATEITYMYHLIAKYKVKGLTKETYLFAEVLRKIGDISKIISYYDTSAKNLSTDIQKWVAAFEPEDQKQPMEKETVKAKKLSPKKKESVNE